MALHRDTLTLTSPTLYLLVFSTVTTVLVVAFYNARRNAKNLPPGPPKTVFFGNLLQVNALRPYPQFRQWALKYGPIFHLSLGPQNLIVLNTAEAADELFVNRSKNYSGRFAPHVAHDIMSDGQRMLFMPYDKEWKAVRKSLHSHIGPGASKRLRAIQELESRVLLHDLIQYSAEKKPTAKINGFEHEVSEDHWFASIRRFTTSVVMNVTYGKRVHRLTGNRYLHKIYEVVENVGRVAQPGNYLVDAFPIMKKLPDFLAPWRKEGRRMHINEMEVWGGLLDEMKEDTKNGDSTDCYVRTYMKERAAVGNEDAPGRGLTDDGFLRDKLLAYTAGSVLEAGSDTTAGTMQTFVLFMLSHPHVLRKAREELDEVVGNTRMPDFEDESKLPYLVACIKETLRRRPSIIMGVPHVPDQDDMYNGYFIPKGSTVIGNVWAIHMDPNRYPNPTAFDPERFYVKGKATEWRSGPDSIGRDHYVFGWGRRFCQGSNIAEATLFITLSRLIWGIDFQSLTDPKTGTAIIPDIAEEENTWSDGFLSVPKVFDVRFNSRSAQHSTVIERVFREAQSEWQNLELKQDERD